MTDQDYPFFVAEDRPPKTVYRVRWDDPVSGHTLYTSFTEHAATALAWKLPLPPNAERTSTSAVEINGRWYVPLHGAI